MAAEVSSLLDVTPTLRELCDHVFTNRWYELGVELEIKSADLEEIRRDSTVTDKLSRMYQMWLSKKTKAATRRQLIEALKTDHVGQISVAINYEQELNKMVKDVDVVQPMSASTSDKSSPTTDIDVLTPVMKTGSHHRRLAQTERYLRSKFHRLFVAVKDSVSKIDVSKLKFYVQILLIDDQEPSQALSTQEYLENMKEQKTPGDILIFLITHEFISYRNPQLLQRIVECLLSHDLEVMSQMNQYIMDYESHELSLEELRRVSCEKDLSPRAPSGLQEFENK